MAKPRKVEEPAGTYNAPAKREATRRRKAGDGDSGEPKFIDDKTAQQLTDRIFAERKELLHKLAQ